MPTHGGDQGPDRLDPDRDPRHPQRQDALAAEADPRHPPRSCPTTRRSTSKRIYEHAEEHRTELNLYIAGEEDVEPEPDEEELSQPEVSARTEGATNDLKLAYWPGCVSRGFTTELHGSMALVADRLGIELVTLDRANCCGAGVIAEHNQELADTLNARTFALAQQTGLAMMNICSTCQGAQSECQQRLDADSAYRAHINEVLAGEGLELRQGQGRLRRTRTSSGSWSRTTASTSCARR